MANLTADEKQLLRTAKKLRQIVKADVEKTTGPAFRALLEALGPTLSSLGLEAVAVSFPTPALGQVAQNLVRMTNPGLDKTGEAKARTLRTITAVESILTKAGMQDAKSLATKTVLASVRVAAEHRKTPDVKLTKAVALINEAQAEIALLREFV